MEAMAQDEARRQAHYEKMTQTPVPKLVTTLAIPTIISMMVSAIYNMADTFFVSQLGTSAVGAVGIVFSLMAIIQPSALHWVWVQEPSYPCIWGRRKTIRRPARPVRDSLLLS